MSDVGETTPASAPLGLRERKKARTRQEILDAAAELFAAVGYEDAHTAAIAERAEVAEATLFRYFPTKADLAVDRARQISVVVVGAIEARPADERPFEALWAVARSEPVAGFFTKEAREEATRLLANPEVLALAFLVILSSADRLALDFVRRQDSDPSDPGPVVMAHAVLGAVIAQLQEWIEHDTADPHQRFLDHVEVLRPLLD